MTGTQVLDLDFKPKSPIDAAIEIYGEFSADKSRMEAEGSDLLHNILAGALRKIAEQFTTETYEFILAIDKFVEQSITCITEPLKYILNEYIPCRDDSSSHRLNMSTLFCAYYALSLVYKKKDNTAGLKMLLDADQDLNKGTKYDVFRDFPLYYEVLARCYKHQNHLHTALDYDQEALNRLKDRGIANCGVAASYASTVAMMLDKHQTVADRIYEKAREYIEDAISYNPQYAKYYYLKAELQFFYAMCKDMDFEDFEKLFLDAVALIEEKALKIHKERYSSPSIYREYEEKQYDKFRVIIQQEYEKRNEADKFDPVQIRKHIADASSYEDYSPPMPDLDADQPYFYICYAAKDFKSVYYDMAELFERKIPFKFNQHPTMKNSWNATMKADIKSDLCMGVVFYISKNTLTCKPLCRDIRKVCQELKKPHFAVNLEGKTKPSRILIDTILEVCGNRRRSTLDGSHLRSFLMAFPDNEPWTAKDKHHGDDNTRHFNDYLQRLRSIFNMEI